MVKKLKVSAEQLAEGLSEGLARGDAVALQASQRQVRLLDVKAKSLERLLARSKDGPALAKRERWQQRRAQYLDDLAAAELALRWAEVRPHPLVPFEGRPGAYGRVIDEHAKPWPKRELRLATPDGKTLATDATDEQGFFSLWSKDEHEGDVDIVAVWANQTFPLRRGERSLQFPRTQLVVPRKQRPPGKAPSSSPAAPAAPKPDDRASAPAREGGSVPKKQG
jgi:hypothetical protein